MLTIDKNEEQRNVKVIETLQKHIVERKDRIYIYEEKMWPGKRGTEEDMNDVMKPKEESTEDGNWGAWRLDPGSTCGYREEVIPSWGISSKWIVVWVNSLFRCRM